MSRNRFLGYSIAMLLTSFTGCSCQTEDATMANPEAVYQQYSVSYDGASNQTSVTARFRFGGFTGTNLRLNGAAGVKHNAFTLKENTFTGAHYVGSGAGFIADHTFEYTDINGKVLKNAIRLNAIDFPADLPAEISRSRDARMAFAGDPIADDEAVDLSVTQKAPAQDNNQQNVTRQFSNKAAGAKDVLIAANELAGFAEGEANIMLTRRRSHAPPEATSRGGTMSATYTTASRKVTIVK